MSTPSTPTWTPAPAILTILQRLQTLSARLARLEAIQQAERTLAVMKAHQ